MAIAKRLWDAKRVEKEWGTEYWLTNSQKYCAKLLVMKGGYAGSLHRHYEKDETLTVVKGEMRLHIQGGVFGIDSKTMGEGDWVRLAPGDWHRLEGLADETWIMEASTHHDDMDVERATVSGKLRREMAEAAAEPGDDD